MTKEEIRQIYDWYKEDGAIRKGLSFEEWFKSLYIEILLEGKGTGLYRLIQETY